MNFAQCYYTSIGGWTAVGSSDLSQAAKQAFVSVQTTNAPKNQHYLDASGKPLALFEIESDGKNAYAGRCRYGILDQRGRPNMFAHGFICQWNKDLTVDPAPLCFIDDENYAQSKDEVSLEEQPKISMVRGFAAGMQAAGFSLQNFKVLTLAIYGCMERSEPLYIAAAQEGKALQALIYCIYLSMPYAVRQKLSFANAAIPGAKAKTVIFCKPENLPQKVSYFNLQTGDTNVVTADWIKKNKKNTFMSRFGVMTPDAAQKYFAQLDAKLIQLGKQDSVSYKVMQLADTLMQIDQGAPLQTDDVSLLYSMLSTPVADEKMMDAYIASVLDRLVSSGTELTEEMLSMVMERLQRTENTDMLKIKAYFRRKRLLTLPLDEAAADLLDIKQHANDGALQEQEFRDAYQYLVEFAKGREIFGAAIRLDYLQSRECDYEKLADVYDDCTKLECEEKGVTAFIKEQAYELFCTAMTKDGVLAAYKPFETFIGKFLNPTAAEEVKVMARNRYWDLYDLTAFTTADREAYQLMVAKDHPNCLKALNYWEIRSKMKQASLDDVARMHLAMMKKGDLTAKECSFLFEKCVSYCVEHNQNGISDSSALIRLATYASRDGKQSLVSLLSEYGLPAQPETWVMLLKSAPCFMEDGEISVVQVARFVQTVQAEEGSDKELVAAIATGYNTIADEKKQQEKLAQQAQRAEQWQQRKEQAGAMFNKFSSLIGKKGDVPAEDQTDTVPDMPPAVTAPDEENDVIYSGRDLGQMNGTSEEEQPKKSKLSGFLGKFKK